MPKHRSHLLLCTLALSWPTSARAQQIPAAIEMDPPPDKEFPATMEAPDIMSHGSRLNAVLFMASGKEPHPTILLMHGFPGNEKNLDLAYAVRRAGWNVLIPHYRGSWGSEGKFSFSNAIEDTRISVQFLRDAENVKKYRIDPKKIVLVGHSMGGFMVAYGAAHDPDVAGLVMISAWNIGETMTGPKETHRVDTFPSASIRLAGSTPAGLQEEAEANAARWNYFDYAEALRNRPMLVLESDDRNKLHNHAMVEALRKAGNSYVAEIHMETDHSYSDHRIALQSALLNWLQATFPPAAK
jgi:pimeloyl-ACP methyl ester carboxylesterase